MDEQSKKRTRRTPQQMVEDIDSTIGKLNQELETIAVKRAAANEDFDKKETAVKGKIAALEQRKRTFLRLNRRASLVRLRSRKSKI